MSIAADSSRPREEDEHSASTCARSCPTFPSEMPAERLTDDLLVEILSRVPAKPFHFTSLSGSRRPSFDTSFTFLPKPSHHITVDLLNSCNGLLLYRWHDASAEVGASHYVVCNPAMEKWIALPNSGNATDDVATTYLGFNPAMSSHFHVFELVYENTDFSGVSVYSSETGGWVYKKERWSRPTWLASWHSSLAVFLDGHLFFSAFDLELSNCVAAVDTKGETWMKFSFPSSQVDGFIQLSHGRLHYASFERDIYGVSIR
ncbi:hypothetical protein ZWY2020_016920 [Hordeum vulgare]|nr:hypothetical protein ZWY2020_016920 [Hordeum vulgare]